MPSPPESGPFDGPAPPLGPYRVIRPLGRGGMGEVVLAEDPRLGRRVAIKRLHRDDRGGGDLCAAERHERFRREARTLAKLRHPAIVQVYELLTVEGRDHLVMEHVDGPTLRQVLDDGGPLPAGEVIELARCLAEGLDHAHRHGIVHRDLKTENVLLDTDGAPRLVDFGLACSGAGDLTEDGRVLGTVRAMAPEQVAGDGVDARTDLFALGVLIFELLTGRSPFEAATRRETVARVLGEPAPCLDGIGVSPELAGLVAHLLEKDPALRPRSAGEVAARLAEIDARGGETRGWSVVGASPSPSPSAEAAWPTWALVVIALLVVGALVAAAFVRQTLEATPEPTAAQTAEELPRLHVAVLPTEVTGVDETEAEKVEFVVRSAVLRTLGELERVVPVGLGEVDQVAEGATPVDVARATAADQLVWSEARCDATECLVELARLDGTTGAVLWSQPAQAPRADLETLSWATGEAVASGLAERVGEGSERLPAGLLTELLPLRWARSRESLAIDPEAEYERLGELEALYGPYLELSLWRARSAYQVFRLTGETAWLELSFDALERAEGRDPGSVEPLLKRVDIELDAGRLDDAGQTLERLRQRVPGDVRVDELRARWLMARGATGEALATLATAVERRPSWSRLYNLARMASDAGEVELAFEALAALEQRAPGYPPARRLAADLEMKYGDVDRAARLYEELATGSRSFASWTNLGVAHLLRRDAPAALEALSVARDLAPESYHVELNLADAHVLAGDDAAARRLYASTAARLEDAPDTRLDVLLARSQARARLGRDHDAVADVEKALRLAPEDADVRFVAALVYGLVGDLTSAERNRRRALEMGYAERWFSLEPFDVLGETRDQSPGGGS